MEGFKGQVCQRTEEIKTKTSGDAGPAYTSSWRLFDIISFLRDSVKHRQYVISHCIKIKIIWVL